MQDAMQIEHLVPVAQTLAGRQRKQGHAVGLAVQTQGTVGQSQIGLDGGLAPQITSLAVVRQGLLQASQAQGVVGVAPVQGA